MTDPEGWHQSHREKLTEHFMTMRAHWAKRAGSGNETKGSLEVVALDDGTFTAELWGHDRLWQITTSTNPSEMERRLISAAEWIGKSRDDADSAKCFVQVVFALEAILQYEQKNSLVSPSIITEWRKRPPTF